MGTAIPIPIVGTAAGFLAGLGTGVVMELDFLPDVTGDGEKDSLGDVAGYVIEEGWHWIRNDSADFAEEAWDEAKDLAGDFGDSEYNPANWF